MAFFRTRVFVGIICFLAGLLVGRLRWGQNPFYVSWWSHGPRAPAPMNPMSPTDPFEEMRRMQEQMMNSFGNDPTSGARTFSFGAPDFKDTGSAYVMEVELNGMTPKNFNVQVERGELMIEGSLESNQGGAVVSSHFQRSFPVPEDVDTDRIQVDTKKDRLVVTLPKKKAE